MNGREHFLKMLNQQSNHCGFWHGYPNSASVEYLYKAFHVRDDHELGRPLSDCCVGCFPRNMAFGSIPKSSPYLRPELHRFSQP